MSLSLYRSTCKVTICLEPLSKTIFTHFKDQDKNEKHLIHTDNKINDLEVLTRRTASSAEKGWCNPDAIYPLPDSMAKNP